MKLCAVFYELYESDLLAIRGHENEDVHEISREVRLETDGGSIYVSWTDKPIQFCIGYQKDHWFRNDADAVLEASAFKLWVPLIGQDVALSYLDSTQSCLELRSKTGSVFFTAEWEGVRDSDGCRISRQGPHVRT